MEEPFNITLNDDEVRMVIRIPLQPFLKIIDNNIKVSVRESTQQDAIMCGKELQRYF